MRHRPSTYSRAWPQSRVEIAETEAFLPAKLIAAAARVILRVTKVLRRRELRDRIGFRSTNAFVGFAAIDYHPTGLKFGDRLKDRLFELEDAHCLKQAKHAEAIRIGRLLRRLETHLNVALHGQVVNFVGLGFLHQSDQVH